MEILVGPTGNLVRGTVFDVSKSALETELRAYDKQLFLKWNPKKRSGLGCWELHRSPDKKMAVFKGKWNGMAFFNLEYPPYDFISHVFDVPCLTYRMVELLRERDLYRIVERKPGEDYTVWMDRVEKEAAYRQAKFEEELNRKASEESAYTGKQYKKEIRAYREMILSGLNPALIAKHWNDKK